MDPLAALYEVLYAHLRNGGIWGENLEPRALATARLPKPYLLFFWAGGGRDESVPVRDRARFTLTIKGVHTHMADALGMSDSLTRLLHNSGSQDVDPRLPDHPDWHITAVTEGRQVWIEEMFEGASAIYHAGHQYDFRMERK